MKRQTVFGIIIAIIGLNILFNSFHLSLGSLIGPLIFILLAIFFLSKRSSLFKRFYFQSFF
ncbi:hypothetical protein [Bacillus sp. JCM 19034]|uniref:hypothetical protein n=1 Tax=Bacillus sp. JCM 19034 TaxID=1481928 RepID=UPI000784B02C|nr:hypothetical protein [Bacillus sp. JCM 19034]